MRRFRFPIAVAVTSLALVALAGGAVVLGAQAALAQGPWAHPLAGQLPPELQGLHDLPPAERFAHFVGARLELKDKDNKPLTLNLTPGRVTVVSDSSLTITANDGTTKTFTLDGQTVYRSKGEASTRASLTAGDMVVVLTHNAETRARVVADGNHDGFAPGGPGGWRRHFVPGR